MLWTLTASLATTAASCVVGSHNRGAGNNNVSGLIGNEIFLCGAAFGAGISLFCLTIQREFRVLERCKLTYKSWYGSNDAPLRTPISILETDGRHVQMGEEGKVEVLVSNEIVASPTMNITTLTLSPGAELPSQRSRGAEFYYVVSGRGTFSQQYINGTFDIQARDIFMVDPGSIRWITNRKGTEDLVLLRAGDNGTSSHSNKGDWLRMDPNLKTLTTVAMDQLREGIRQVQKITRLRSFDRASSVETHGSR